MAAGALTVVLKLDAAQARSGLQEVAREAERAEQTVRRRVGGAFETVRSSVRRVGQELSSVGTGGLDQLARGAEISTGRFLKLSAVAGVVGSVAVSAFHAITDAVREGVQALAQQESLEKRIEAALRRRGEAAAELTQRLSENAEELKRLNAVDDDAIRGAQLVFLTYRNIAIESLPRVSQAAIDLALSLQQVTGENVDLMQVSRMLGRALNDPAQGMAALTRAGIQLDEQTRNYIESLQKQGRLQEAQAVLLQEIEKRVGGTGEAFAQSAQGIRQSLELALADLGKAFAPVVLEIQRSVISPIVDLLNAIIPLISQIARTIGDALAPIFRMLAEAVAPVVKSLVQALEPIGRIVAQLASVVAQALKPLLDAVSVVLQQIAEILGEVFSLIAQELQPILQEMGQILGELAREVGAAFLETFRELKPILRDIAIALARSFVKAMQFLVEVTRVAAPVVAYLARLFGQVLAKALQIARVAINLVIEAGTWLVDKLKAIWEWVVGVVKAVLEFFGVVKQGAQQSQQPVEKTAQAVQELGASLDALPDDQELAPNPEKTEERRNKIRELRDEVRNLARELADAARQEQRQVALLQLQLMVRGLESSVREVQSALQQLQSQFAEVGQAFVEGTMPEEEFQRRANEIRATFGQLLEEQRRLVREQEALQLAELRAQHERELEELKRQEEEKVQAIERKQAELNVRLKELQEVRERFAELRALKERTFALQVAQLEQQLAAERAEREQQALEQILAFEAQVASFRQQQQKRLVEEQKRAVDELQQTWQRWSDVATEAFSAFWQGQGEAARRFLSVWLDALLQQVENELAIAIFRVTAQELASKPFPLGLATAAIATGILRAAFAAMRAAIKGFREGGWTGEGATNEVAGVVHRREYVVPAPWAERFRPVLDEIRRGRLPQVLPTGQSYGRLVVELDDALVLERLEIRRMQVRVRR